MSRSAKELRELKNLRNLFSQIPEKVEQELVNELLRDSSIRIERIVSRGQSSPPDFWYDQTEHEWIVVLAGKATLQIEGHSKMMKLGPGDTLHLPAHTRHRVEWTDSQQDTIWLAVFWKT